MRAGESATVICPAYLVDQSIDESEDDNKGRKYFLDVLECSSKPDFLEHIEENRCLSIRNIDTDLAVTADEDQIYDGKYGIYNIGAKEFQPGNKAQ